MCPPLPLCLMPDACCHLSLPSPCQMRAQQGARGGLQGAAAAASGGAAGGAGRGLPPAASSPPSGFGSSSGSFRQGVINFSIKCKKEVQQPKPSLLRAGNVGGQALLQRARPPPTDPLPRLGGVGAGAGGRSRLPACRRHRSSSSSSLLSPISDHCDGPGGSRLVFVSHPSAPPRRHRPDDPHVCGRRGGGSSSSSGRRSRQEAGAQ